MFILLPCFTVSSSSIIHAIFKHWAPVPGEVEFRTGAGAERFKPYSVYNTTGEPCSIRVPVYYGLSATNMVHKELHLLVPAVSLFNLRKLLPFRISGE